MNFECSICWRSSSIVNVFVKRFLIWGWSCKDEGERKVLKYKVISKKKQTSHRTTIAVNGTTTNNLDSSPGIIEMCASYIGLFTASSYYLGKRQKQHIRKSRLWATGRGHVGFVQRWYTLRNKKYSTAATTPITNVWKRLKISPLPRVPPPAPRT